jgi:hypothetical protein
LAEPLNQAVSLLADHGLPILDARKRLENSLFAAACAEAAMIE